MICRNSFAGWKSFASLFYNKVLFKEEEKKIKGPKEKNYSKLRIYRSKNEESNVFFATEVTPKSSLVVSEIRKRRKNSHLLLYFQNLHTLPLCPFHDFQHSRVLSALQNQIPGHQSSDINQVGHVIHHQIYNFHTVQAPSLFLLCHETSR